MISQYFIPLFAAMVSVLLLTPICIKTAFHSKLIDIPNSAQHKIHKMPVSIAGGIAIVFTIFLITLISGRFFTSDIRSILLASIPVFLFGILDDAKGLSPPWKLLGQLTGAILLIWQDIYIKMFESSVLDISLTLFWLVGITNAFNLVDSMDGLAIGLAANAGAFFLLVTVDANQPDLTYLSAVIFGSCIGMFYFNSTPAKTFLGDSGSQYLGFVLAALALAHIPPGPPQLSSWFVPILFLSVPVFDTTLVVFSRIRRRLPIYKAGQDHIYHRLIGLGMSSNQAVTIMHVSAFITSCVAFIALPLPPLWANVIFLSTMLCGFYMLFLLEAKQSKQ